MIELAIFSYLVYMFKGPLEELGKIGARLFNKNISSRLVI
jgi:hypothetical protein